MGPKTTWVCTLMFPVIVIALIGCTATAVVRRSCTQRNLIFNPESSPVPPEAFVRSEWPTATGGIETGEVVDYAIVTRDDQGRRRNQYNEYRRTSESVRTGRTHSP